DIIANKKTYLLIKALEKAKGKTKSELNTWLIAQKFNKQEKVDAVKSIFTSLNIPQLTERKANQYFKKAFSNLDKIIADSAAKENLKEYASTLVARQS